jgi:hypothetical protein
VALIARCMAIICVLGIDLWKAEYCKGNISQRASADGGYIVLIIATRMSGSIVAAMA